MQAQPFKSWRPIFIPTKRKTSAIVQVSRTFGKYSLESLLRAKRTLRFYSMGCGSVGTAAVFLAVMHYCRDEGFGAS
jgi:hypothetical protein